MQSPQNPITRAWEKYSRYGKRDLLLFMLLINQALQSRHAHLDQYITESAQQKIANNPSNHCESHHQTSSLALDVSQSTHPQSWCSAFSERAQRNSVKKTYTSPMEIG